MCIRDRLCSGQPVAPYFGSFHYTSKNTVITPQKVYPIYALDRLVPDTEQVSLYEQQSLRLDSIKVEAKNEHDVDWYGFNPRLSGEWTVVDEGLNDASEYAEVTTNRNGYPVLKALKMCIRDRVAPMGYGKTTAVEWYLAERAGAEAPYIVRISVYSVSYTHLDVYKRQCQDHTRQI